MKREGSEQGRPKNMKNIYIQKLSKYFGLSRQSLIEVEQQREQGQRQPTVKREIRSAININGTQGKDLADKLQKNRESARKARKRKKLYVKLLERQVEKYKEIAAQGKELERDAQRFTAELKSHINKKKDHSALRKVVLDNISNAVSFAGHLNQTDANALVLNYQAKYGPSSPQRFESLDSCLEQIREILLPSHITGIFNSDGIISYNTVERLLREIQKGGGKVQPKQVNQIKQGIDRECGKLNGSLNVLKQTIDMAKQQLREINKTLDDMRQLHGGGEICRFLMMIEEETGKPGNVKEFRQFLEQLVQLRLCRILTL